MSSCNMLQLKSNFNQQRRTIRDAITQTKPSIGQSNDKYEQEADCVADKVMRMSETKAQLQAETEEKEEPSQTKFVVDNINHLIQRQAEPEKIEEEEKIEKLTEPIMTKTIPGRPYRIEPEVVKGLLERKRPGFPLTQNEKKFMNYGFGRDFSGVRLHTDDVSSLMCKKLNAKAFTNGLNVYFANGQYNPTTNDGKKLLAHELTHVSQQRGEDAQKLQNPKLDTVNSTNIQRKINISGSDWDKRKGQRYIWGRFNRLIKKSSGSRLKRLKMKRWILWDRILKSMIESTQVPEFKFGDKRKLYQYLLRRYWMIEGMQYSQSKWKRKIGKKRRTFKCCGYPRPKNIYSPQVNKAAQKYWTHLGGFKFELNEEGKKKGDLAVKKLFKKWASKRNRTLIDCTHMIVAIHYYSLMKSLGAKIFRQRVNAGTIKVKIISPWHPPVLASGGGILTVVTPKNKDELIPGDHVYFWNHKTYPALLNKLRTRRNTTIPTCANPTRQERRTCQDIWRGEHAVYLRNDGKVRKFLGHGSGVLSEKVMINKLLKHYNCHVKQAQKCMPPITTIDGHTLRILKPAEIPGLRDKDDLSKMWQVRRPVVK